MNNSSILELNNRKLDNCLFSIIIIPVKAYFKTNNNFSIERELYLFFSCNIQGKRKYITTVFKDKYPKVSDWYDFILSLKAKGINITLYAIIPNNDFLSKALKLAFNEINIYVSFLEIYAKLTKYHSANYANRLFEEVRKLYLTSTLEEYDIYFNSFKEEYLNLPFINDLLEEDLKRIKPYYDIELNFRKYILSFYFCRELFKRLVVISHSKDSFSSIDEFITCILPDIRRIELKMFCSKKDLKFIINKVYTQYGNLIKSYLWCIIYIN